MSDESQAGDGSQAPDPFKQLKSEMDRKLSKIDSVESQMAEINRTNAALLAQLAAMQPKQAVQAEDDISSLMFDNPKEAVKRIKEQTKSEMRQEYDRDQANQLKTQQTINKLTNDYPELNNPSHELTKKAIALYNELSDEEKRVPASYKAAVREAAIELGVVPMSKRTFEEQDAFSVGTRSSNPARQSKEDSLDPKTVEFARHCGLDVDNPEVLASLKKTAKRGNWNRYQKP